MKRTIPQIFLAAALAAFLFDGNAFAQSPAISNISPLERTAGAPGNFTLTLTGSNFCPDSGSGSTISFITPHTATTPTTGSSSTVITAPEVAIPGTVSVTLTTNAMCPPSGGVQSNAVDFTINPPLIPDSTPFPKATRNYPFSAPILILGGTGPFTITVQSGSLPPGLSIDPVDYQIQGTATALGTFPFVLSIVDSGGAQTTAPNSIVVEQATLSVFQGSPQTTVVGTGFQDQLVARLSDANGFPLFPAPITFNASGTGAGGTFSGSAVQGTDDGGVATAPPFTANTVAGTYTVVASAPGTSSTAVFNLTNTPGPPATVTATGGATQSTPINTTFPVALQATVRDSFGNPVPGATVNFLSPEIGATGEFVGPATSTTNAAGVATAAPFTANSVLGSYTVEAIVGGLQTPAIFNLTNATPAPANISATGGILQFAPLGSAFPNPLQATVTDIAGNPSANVTVTFSVPASGPSAVFQSGGTTATAQTNGSGIATSPALTANNIDGSYSASATVAGLAKTANYSLTNTPGLSITTRQLPGATVGLPYDVSVDAAGGASPYTFSIVTGTLPQGLTLSSSGAIRGTPTAAGSFPILVEVADSLNARDSRGLTIVVTAPLTITNTSPLPGAYLTLAFSQTLVATGGQSPYTWSILSGAMPDGLTLNGSTGVVSGTPIAVGESSFVVQVTDAAQRRLSKSFALTSAPASSAPVIQVSTNSLSFEAPTGGSAPSPQYIALVASNQQPLSAVVTIDGGASGSPAPAWLGARLESTVTPARLEIITDQAGLPSGSYNGRVLVTYPGVQTQIVNVGFSIKATPPQLSVSPGFLRFATTLGSPNPTEQDLLVGNSGGGGALDFTVSVVSRSSWLSVTPSSGVTSVSGGVPVKVIANAGGLRIGSYFDKIRIQSATGGAVEVAVSLFVSPNGAIIGVNPVGIRFDAREGNGLASPREISILNQGSGSVNWRAELQAGQGWLALGSSAGQAAPGSPTRLTLTADPRTLKAGSYHGLIRITDPQALNSPQYAVVVLKVAPATAAPEADLSPVGLYFTAIAGGVNPAPQTLQVFVNSDQSTAFQAAASTSWLSIDKPTGTASTQSPGQIAVSIKTAGLKAGVYSGEVSVSLSTPTIRNANVTVVVLPEGATLAGSDKNRAATSCTPGRLAVTSSSLTNAFASPAGWPTPLIVRLTDDCGTPAANAHVVATFSNGDPPLTLSLTNPSGALYSGTWAPGRITPQMTVTLIGLSDGLANATAKLTGTVDANAAPSLNPNGITNNLNPTTAGAALAPGTVAQIYGDSLAPSTQQPGQLPLPTAVDDTTVLIGLVKAPLYYVSDGQLNAQIPTELQPDRQYSILVSSGAAFTLPETITIASVSPGLTEFAQHADYTPITPEAPIQPGESIILYLVGMGATDQTVASGAASPADPPAKVNSQPTVTIGGKPATVDFAGLSPGTVGLYQVNIQTPLDLASGNVSVVVTQGETSSNAVTLPVQ